MRRTRLKRQREDSMPTSEDQEELERARQLSRARRDALTKPRPNPVPPGLRPNARFPSLTEDQVRQIVLMPAYLRAAMALIFSGTLRKEEALGLRRQDVNLKRGTVKVEWEWCWINANRFTLTPARRPEGERTVQVPADVMEAVKEHLLRHVGVVQNAWLFPSSGENPIDLLLFEQAVNQARETLAGEERSRKLGEMLEENAEAVR